MPGKDGTLHATPPLIREKLAAFEQLEPAFRESFRYVEQMHGEARFPTVPVAAIVRYLHALFICHRKDGLLSVPTTTARYDHRLALDLLDGWQRGQTLAVVEFLEAKLDMQPFLPVARELEAAEVTGDADGARRLRHGLQVLLNRAHNLYAALDAIFGLPREGLLDEVRGACAQFGHTPDEIRTEREWLATPPYSYVPHAELSRRNMLVMNRLGVAITSELADRPGGRTARVLPGKPPLPAYAENPLPHETEFTPPPYSTPPYFPTEVAPPVADEGPEQIVARDSE
jgi:hypothetical protein